MKLAKPRPQILRESLPVVRKGRMMRVLQFHRVRAFLLLALSTNYYPHTVAIPVARALKANYTAKQIPATSFFYLPDGKQAENMVIGSSGQVLVTFDTALELYQINPFHNQTGGIVYHFEGYTSLFGIVEERIDIFYITGSNFSGPPDYYGHGCFVSIFEVNLRNVSDPIISQSAVKVLKVVDVPEAQLLDGLTIVNEPRGLLMSGDAQTGTLYLNDIHKHAARAVLQDELFNGTSQEVAAGLDHISINGLKFHDGDLYFTNTAKGLYCWVPIDNATGKPTARPSILSNYHGTYVDDFSFDSVGNRFISEDETGILLRPADITTAKNHTRLLTILSGADPNAFGRTAIDQCTLYATFAGTPVGVASIDVRKEGFCA
ncbi:MAG: hypothetical protein Q9175_005362 [Cornicularia normoerica]